jgi:hypothetical protein
MSQKEGHIMVQEEVIITSLAGYHLYFYCVPVRVFFNIFTDLPYFHAAMFSYHVAIMYVQFQNFCSNFE